jgi:hypothetical protein
MTTSLSILGLPSTYPGAIDPKPPVGLPLYGTRIGDFDLWRRGYAGLVVEVLVADTTERARLYSDALLGTEIANPQTLLSYTDATGQLHGKWATAVYTTSPYRLLIDNTDVTGIDRPAITDMAGQDTSEAVVSSRRGQYLTSVQDALDQVIFATMYGQISEQAGEAASTATIEAAIGAAAAQGGGFVEIPAGTITISAITLPQGVRLRGQGKNATTLVCRDSGGIVTLGGDGSGLEGLTLDGQLSTSGSIGIHGHDVTQAYLRDILVRRFDIGISFQGLSETTIEAVAVSDCAYGIKFLGDSDATGQGDGAAISDVQMIGGSVTLCTQAGITLEYVDLPVTEVLIQSVGFVSCVGAALKIVGARGIEVRNCYWTGNTLALSMEDGNDTAYSATNTVQRVTVRGGDVSGGELRFDGWCTNIMFDGVNFADVDFNMTVPRTPVVLRNCIEDATTTSTGDTKKLARQTTFSDGEWTGITTDATPTTAAEFELQPGETGLFSAQIIGSARNAITYGVFWIMAGARRPGATLNFNLQTGNFTAGLVVTGATSGASARIIAVSQAAGSGTLTLRDITGTFQSGELITDTSTGSARVSGFLSTSNAALDATGTGVLRANTITGTAWDAVFAASGSMIRCNVTGEAGVTIEWTVRLTRLVP